MEVSGQGLWGKKWSQKRNGLLFICMWSFIRCPRVHCGKKLRTRPEKKKRYLLIKGFLLCFFTDTVTAFAMKRQYYSGQLLHISALPCCDRTHRYSLLANSLDCTGTVEAAMAMRLQTLYLPHPSWLRTPCLLLRCVDLTRLSRQNKPGTLWPNSNEEVCQILLFLKTQAGTYCLQLQHMKIRL